MKPLRNLLLAFVIIALPATDAMAQRRKPAGNTGEMLAQSCFACHGPKGASMAAPMPTIGGQKEAYINGVLREFKEGKRPSTIMSRLMKGYSDADIAAIAVYVSRQTFVAAAQTIDPARVELGRKGYNSACKRCHLEGGRESSEPEYPILAGQWLPYMQLTMADILSGKRTVDDKFRASLDKLSADEVDAVLHFYAAQR